MSQGTRIIINASGSEYLHHNGLSGIFVVPGKKKNEEFGMLVVYDAMEVQDLGENRATQNHDWAKAKDLAESIVGTNSNAGPRAKWGLLVCEATPDMPRELEKAIEDEIHYLNRHRPQARYVKDEVTGAAVLENAEKDSVIEMKIKLSENVQLLRAEFEDDCRKLVKRSEIGTAKRNLQIEDQRLVAEADQIWAGPEGGRVNVNELHKAACIRLGQARPWSYVAQQLQPCPGCGGMIPENVIVCQMCNAILDSTPEEYSRMSPKEKARSLYPERYAEPVSAKTGAPVK